VATTTIRLRLPIDLLNIITAKAEPKTMGFYIRRCIEYYLEKEEHIKYNSQKRREYNDGRNNRHKSL